MLCGKLLEGSIPSTSAIGSVDLTGKAADSKSVVWRILRVWVRVLPLPLKIFGEVA